MPSDKESENCSNVRKIVPKPSATKPSKIPKRQTVMLDPKECFWVVYVCGLCTVVKAGSWQQEGMWTKFYAESDEELTKVQRSGKSLLATHAVNSAHVLQIYRGDSVNAEIDSKTKWSD